MPQVTAKTSSQNANSRRCTGLPVARYSPSAVASQAAGPMVKA